jgi:hypothetical protein
MIIIWLIIGAILFLVLCLITVFLNSDLFSEIMNVVVESGGAEGGTV